MRSCAPPKRGVTVRVITDGIGTESNLPMFELWKARGVEHRIYNPHLLFGPQGWSRTHRKLALIDETFAFCGGINIVDDYDQNGTRLERPRWDFAMEAQGPVVRTCAKRSISMAAHPARREAASAVAAGL